jgi:hypothetical protein
MTMALGGRSLMAPQAIHFKNRLHFTLEEGLAVR